ncbi:MAG: endonuclease Q family protein [Candidatus Woesearchaeota archaeon]|nr:endonuclease Q family protein [Candidatus Woesearchaeota archaeon]
MHIIGDFHIHGRYAQACSKKTTLEDLERNARIKGLHILGTGDAQHPLWHKEITSKLTEDENGILWSKTKFPFIWQTEISLMYSQGGRGRRIHHVVLFPNGEVVKQFIDALLKKGRIDYDGRPIFGMSSIEFLDMLRSISTDIEVIPGHAWTSFFGVLGSKSGFDSVEECFQERAKYIHAIESGISSDPAMNWRISSLDKYNIVSFSDPHSSYPWRLGREATIFDLKELTYKNILQAIRTGIGIKGTIETPPEYGKYHFDGHRACGVMMAPAESRKLNKQCPKCKQEMTIGVEYRVEQLADRPVGYVKPNAPFFHSLIPLHELLGSVYNIKLMTSKKLTALYQQLIGKFGTEYNVLLEAPEPALAQVVDPAVVQVILKNRTRDLKLQPGYDGVYGTILLDQADKALKKQKALTDF